MGSAREEPTGNESGGQLPVDSLPLREDASLWPVWPSELPALERERICQIHWEDYVAGMNRWKINAVTKSHANAKPVQMVWPPATASQSTRTMPASSPATERAGFGSATKKTWRRHRAIH